MSAHNDPTAADKDTKQGAAADATGDTVKKAAGEPKADQPTVAGGANTSASKTHVPDQVIATDPTDSLPMAGLRPKRGSLWATLVIIALVGIVGGYFVYDMMRPRERISVYFTDIHGLHVGSLLEHNGHQVGEVVEIELSEDLTKRRVVIELIDKKVIVDRLRRDGNEFFVSRFASDRMQLKGVTKVIRGSSVIVRLGSPDGERRTEFEGSQSMPPDSRVQWNSVRVRVTFPDVEGLREGALVEDRGKEEGVIEKVVRDTGGDSITVTIAFFATDPAACRYARQGTRYFINFAKLTAKGIEGDASTALYGAQMVAVPDPLSNGTVVTEFQGEQTSPPQNLPLSGEKELILESESWLPPDTPVFYRKKLAGYVLRIEEATDSNSFYVVTRVYPKFAPQICQNSVFFMQAKVNAQLFKSKGLFSWEGPKFEIPDPQVLLRPGIEFRTPANSGKAHNFEKTGKPAFPIHPEAKEEWLKWNASIAVEDPLPPELKGKVVFPEPLRTRFHWRESWRPLVSWRKHEGLVFAVDGGVIGPTELLKPTVAEDKVQGTTFEIGGISRSRKGADYVELAPGVSYMRVELGDKILRLPSTQLAQVSNQPLDCWVVTDPDNPKAVAAAKLSPTGSDVWTVSSDSGFQADWHGAAVICRDRSSPAFGKVIGVFLVGGKGKSATISLLAAFTPGGK